jgi:hypothetical protein
MTNWGNLGQFAQGYKGGDSYYFTNLTQPAAANTKGSYVQMVSSTPFDSERLSITFYSLTYGTYDNLFDIAIGAASSESDIISNILVCRSSSYHIGSSYEFPVRIKAGTRISGRSQGEYSSANNFRVSLTLLRGGWSYIRGFDVCDTYGANTGNSGGVAVDPGGTINTKGSWSQITSSTSRDAKGFILIIGNNSDYTRDSSAYYWNVDVGIGASGSEQVIFPNWGVVVHSSVSTIFPQASPFIPMHIPAGSRLSARASCSGNGSTYRTLDVTIHTFS